MSSNRRIVCSCCQLLSARTPPTPARLAPFTPWTANSPTWRPTRARYASQSYPNKPHKVPRAAAKALEKATKGPVTLPVTEAVASRTPRSTPTKTSNPKSRIGPIREKADAILSSEEVPSEEKILEVFRACESLAQELAGAQTKSPETSSADKSPSSALLSLDDSTSASPQAPVIQDKISSALRKQEVDALSTLTHQLLVHPPVFLSAPVLESYITIQTLLGRPATFPQALALYANKPIRLAGSHSTHQQKTPNPNSPRYAVPAPVADTALTAAIAAKDLTLATDIISNTYATRAFNRSKLLRRALLPFTGAALAPLAVYSVATQFALLQSSMDPRLATNMAFAAMLAYVGFTATIGLVAVSTANDQMDRVTWATGIPLRERWLREEERAAYDRVAGAWGFREVDKRGFEEGDEWEGFREWLGWRGMVLDRSGLMEGME